MTYPSTAPPPTTILILSTESDVPPVLEPYERAGTIIALMDHMLGEHDIDRSTGLITTMHLDQIRFHELAPAIGRFFRRNGRLVFNGHPVKPFIDGLAPFVPLNRPRRRDFALTPLAAHTVFDGIDVSTLETRKGVAGFYGRGHAPLPAGAAALTGLGPDHRPVDWVWAPPMGGEVFVHAGNDLWSVADDPEANAAIARNIVHWVQS